jgi:hypothetical protein
MTSLTPTPRGSRALRSALLSLAGRPAEAAEAHAPGRFDGPAGVASTMWFGSKGARRSAWVDSLDDQLEDPEWLPTVLPERCATTPRDWLFWSFLMCMALAALPLVGARWTAPQSALTGGDCSGALLWALPVVVALPFLFLACVAELAFRPASRTSAAYTTFAAAILIALAAVPGLLS